jgi:pectin methylesterase-like acyl-CoA thioesterase
MKKLFPFFLLACLILSVSARVAFAQVAAVASATPNIVVDNDKAQCPTAMFTKIQDAVTAAKPGDVIRVCAGTYHEQVVMDKDLVIEADNGVVVKPVAVVANATGPSGDSIAAIIFVENASNIQLQGSVVDGSANNLIKSRYKRAEEEQTRCLAAQERIAGHESKNRGRGRERQRVRGPRFA